MYMKGIFDKFPSAGHFYWFQDSKIEGKNIYLFSNNENISNKNDKRIISKLSLNFIKSKTNDFGLSFYSMFKDLKNCKFNYKFSNKLGLLCIKIHCLLTIEHYRKLFEVYDIKLVFHHLEPVGHIPLCIYAASHHKDILTLQNHWSVSRNFSHYTLGYTDLNFSWGYYDNGLMSSNGYIYKHSIMSGMLDGDSLNFKEKKKIKQKKNI